MRTDTVHVEWHLTPRGWVLGDWSANEPLELRTLPPDDREETWVKTETRHGVSFALLRTTWSFKWSSPHHNEADRLADVISG